MSLLIVQEDLASNTVSIPVQTVVIAFLWPLGSIILGCLGFQRARMGSGSSKAQQAKIGKILCIVGLVIAVIVWILNNIVAVGTM